jgi:hypothetical protein
MVFFWLRLYPNALIRLYLFPLIGNKGVWRQPGSMVRVGAVCVLLYVSLSLRCHSISFHVVFVPFAPFSFASLAFHTPVAARVGLPFAGVHALFIGWRVAVIAHVVPLLRSLRLRPMYGGCSVLYVS